MFANNKPKQHDGALPGGGALDCLVIGAGPAGLVAALYLARFRRRVRVIDAGNSRALRIPVSHNLPGFPDGLPGPELIARLRLQVAQHGVHVEPGCVKQLLRHDDGLFNAATDDEVIVARTVILATGAQDIEPALPWLREAIGQGLLRHCPICDGYEVIDQQVGVVGSGSHLVREALFLRTYTPHLSVFSLHRDVAIPPDQRQRLRQAGIAVIDEPIAELVVQHGQAVALRGIDGKAYRFDAVYAAMGATVRSELAVEPGAQRDASGNLVVDQRRFETSVPGLFAAGDVVAGLSQVTVAAGQAAVIATAIHHRLTPP